jgi:hypothetical protein
MPYRSDLPNDVIFNAFLLVASQNLNGTQIKSAFLYIGFCFKCKRIAYLPVRILILVKAVSAVRYACVIGANTQKADPGLHSVGV